MGICTRECRSVVNSSSELILLLVVSVSGKRKPTSEGESPRETVLDRERESECESVIEGLNKGG